MNYTAQAFRLISLIIIAISISSCSNRSRTASSEDELQSLLSDAFLEADMSVVESLSHPDANSALKKDMITFISKWFKVRPERVTTSIIRLSEVPFDISGELNGRKLKHVSPIEGVIHLAGRSDGEHGEIKHDMYFAYSKTNEGYCLSAVDYAE